MRLESVNSFKRRAMGDRTHGPFILGPSEVFLTALFYPPTQKTAPACRNSYLPDALMGHFGVLARAVPVDECGLRGSMIHLPKY
jgi:hypothetical protein